jgi:hypothetical protein
VQMRLRFNGRANLHPIARAAHVIGLMNNAAASFKLVPHPPTRTGGPFRGTPIMKNDGTNPSFSTKPRSNTPNPDINPSSHPSPKLRAAFAAPYSRSSGRQGTWVARSGSPRQAVAIHSFRGYVASWLVGLLPRPYAFAGRPAEVAAWSRMASRALRAAHCSASFLVGPHALG